MVTTPLGGGSTLLGGGTASNRIGREIGPYVPQKADGRATVTQADRDAAAALREFRPVAVELLIDSGGSGDGSSPGEGGAPGGTGTGDSSAAGDSGDAV